MHTTQAEHTIGHTTHETSVTGNTQGSPRKKMLFTVLISLGIIAIVAGLALWRQSGRNQLSPIALNSETVITQVGEDTIFQSDINQYRPSAPNVENAEGHMIAGLTRQSAIIQGALAAEWIEPEDAKLNTPNRSLSNRTQLTERIEAQFNEQRTRVEGSTIGIYFLNEFPGPIGYQEGRRLADQKIRAIYSRLRSGEITMQQAGEIIANDTQLEQVDSSYKTNAYSTFSIGVGQKVTHDPDANDRILSLSEGELSPIITAKSIDLSSIDFSSEDHYQAIEELEPIDALFIIAQVDKRVVGLNYATFEDWVEEQLTTYANNYEN